MIGSAEAEKKHPARSGGATTFVVLAVALDMLAMGVTLPVLPGLIKHLLHGDASQAARYVGWFAALWAAMSFIASPFIGALSDRFGRRPVLLASMFGAAADFALMAWAPTVAWLFIGRAISGITSSSVVTANAYIADVTPEAERAGRFGLLNAAFGIGFILGPLLGGALGQIDPRWPFWAAAGLCAANGVLGVFALRESLPAAARKPLKLARANPFGAFAFYLRSPALRGLAVVMFLYYLAQQMLFSTAIPYIDFRYHWSPVMLGVAFVLVGVGVVVVQAGLVRPFVARFGEKTAVLTGLGGGVAGMAVYAAAATGTQFLLGIPVYSLVGLQVPALQALMTATIGPDEQGRLQGANASLIAVTAMISPPVFTQLLAHAIDSGGPPSTPFVIAAGVLGAALLVAIFAIRPVRVRGVSAPAAPGA